MSKKCKYSKKKREKVIELYKRQMIYVVRKIYKRWEETSSVQNKKIVGRLSKFTNKITHHIDKLIKKKNYIITKEIRRNLIKKYGKNFKKLKRYTKRIRYKLEYRKSKEIEQKDLTSIN